METATPRQLEVLRFVRNYRMQHGYSPTMQEIGDHLRLTKVTVFEHVGALEKKGLLVRGAKHKARSLQVSPDFKFADETPGRIPLLGRIVAGSPIEAIEDRQEIDLAEMFEAGEERFALRVTGDSMIDEHIAEGDIVICDRRAAVRNGQTVVALVGDGEATLKKFYREKGHVRLQPANPNYEPIIVDDVKIQGVVVGVIRKL
jgi:repressor LexA